MLNLNVSTSLYTYIKVVSAGLILTSNANFQDLSGSMTSYASLMNNNLLYDSYRDQPYSRLFRRDESAFVRYIPFDIAELEL